MEQQRRCRRLKMQVLVKPGDVSWAAFAARAPAFTLRRRKATAAQLAGLRFEKEALAFLSHSFPGTFVPRPWFRYMAAGENELRWCQPDGLLFQPRTGIITIVEVKIRHTGEAWQKLSGLYASVVGSLFPAHLWQIALCEFTRMFDCAVACSAQPRLYDSVHQVRPGEFGVVTWKPQR